MDTLQLLTLPTRPFKALCRVPRNLDEVTDLAEEVRPREVRATQSGLDRVWRAVETLYRTGLYPAIQVCLRRRGAVLLNRAIGYAAGNAPEDPATAPRSTVSTGTPFCIYSASKAITAMLVHKLDEKGVLHIDDRVCDYLPEFRVPDKESITISHVLSHRAGIPNIPRGAMDLELLDRPREIVEMLARFPVLSRPGRRLAYHAVTGGFVLGEVVRRATGQDIREVLRKEVLDPLGLRWTSYGVAPEDAPRVARDAATGIPPIPPFSGLFRRALGTGFRDAVSMASDPRFLTGIVPSGNIVTTAEEITAFYQCLLNGGELGGVRILEQRTIRRATVEQSYWELDLTMGLPLRYGLGFMLGGRYMSLFGPDTSHAYGHLGFTNILSWCDPERALSVAVLTSGKPFLNIEILRLFQLVLTIGRAFPKLPD